ncbi:MAG: TIGR00180 family glycosyltransferase, partial [Candidatus Omnitrophica bacterium]|nr:TIGR00180 family glycosyltransferase [Candidatus Omnitrophota bacterium]
MITLMIPTMDRSDFLIRLLQYYADTDYPYSICIGDSSDQTHLERTKEFIKSLDGKLNIRHLEYPNLSISMCLKALVDKLDTPYAAIILDDDFIITKTLEKCIDFLESNPEYSAAHGSALVFSLKNSGVYGEFLNIGRYPQRAVEESTASERLIGHLNNYSVTVFSVQRTETWKKLYQNVKQLSERAFMEELLPCCLSVVHGKIKHY